MVLGRIVRSRKKPFELALPSSSARCETPTIYSTALRQRSELGANIHRTTYCGRNFEYYSEDPFLSGELCKEEVEAISSNGVCVFIKHAALNDTETNRTALSTFANEQSIRQIYLKAFQTPMENVKTAGIMSSMARIGTTWGSAHKGMLTEVMREEWGNLGSYISDNCVLHTYTSGIEGILAGNTLYDAMAGKQYTEIIKEGKNDPVVANALRDAAHHNIYVIVNSHAMNGMTSSSTVKLVNAWWQTLLTTLAIVFFALFAWQLTMAILRTRKFKKENQK